MANNYLQFSESIENLEKVESDWLKSRIDELENRATEGGEDDSCGIGFQWNFFECRNGTHGLHIYEEENGEFHNIETLVKEFLAKFRPTEAFTLTWATTCSRMRIGEFSGGAMVVTATDVDYFEAGDWASGRAKEILAEGRTSQ